MQGEGNQQLACFGEKESSRRACKYEYMLDSGKYGVRECSYLACHHPLGSLGSEQWYWADPNLPISDITQGLVVAVHACQSFLADREYCCK